MSNTIGVHDPLPTRRSIRILTFVGFSSWPWKELRCKLETTDLETIPYDALSYVWSSPHPDESVECNEQKVKVSHNLAAALRSIWTLSPGKRIWADALCIDQENLVEKSHQVRFMHQIYAKARTVLVWLGGSTADSSGILANLKAFSSGAQPSEAELRRVWSGTYPLSMTTTSIFSQKLNIPGFVRPENLQRSLAQLTLHAWFSRAWTFQELIFARQCVVLLGQLSMEWETFCQRAEYISYMLPAKLRLPPADLMRNLDLLDTFLDRPDIKSHRIELSTEINKSITPSEIAETCPGATSAPSLTLLDLLILTRHRQSTDPRDKVFSLINILKPSERPTFEIDYTASVGAINAASTRWCINNCASLDLLRLAATISSKSADRITTSTGPCPSWAVDWTAVQTDQYQQFADRHVGMGPEQWLEPFTDYEPLGSVDKATGRLRLRPIPSDGRADKIWSNRIHRLSKLQGSKAFLNCRDANDSKSLLLKVSGRIFAVVDIEAETGYTVMREASVFSSKSKENDLRVIPIPPPSAYSLCSSEMDARDDVLVDYLDRPFRLKQFDLLVALFGGRDLYVLRENPHPVAAADSATTFMLVAVVAEGVTKSVGWECFRKFRHVDRDFILS